MIKLKVPEFEVTAIYEIVTPMFIGDHVQESKNISPAAFKGVLRFWWRALMWQDHRSNANSDTQALSTLHQAEAEIFGSSAKGITHQSQITIRIKSEKHWMSSRKGDIHPEFRQFTAARYLGLGKSLMSSFKTKNEEAATLNRSCINPNQNFSVVLYSRKPIDDSVIRALKLTGLLGGLGSRTRRGIGSIAIKSMALNGKKAEDLSTANSADYITLLKTTLHSSDIKKLPPNPPFSSFSSDTRVDYLSSADQWIKALDQIGGALLLYRGWGYRDKENKRKNEKGELVTTNNKKMSSETRFKDDHDWYRKQRVESQSFSHPERIIFGLPLAFDSNTQIEATPLKGNDYQQSRRASPLLFHVHKVGKQYAVISTLFQAQFLPETSGLTSTNKEIPLKKQPVEATPSWDLLIDFIEGDTEKLGTRFPDRKVIL